MKSKSRNSKQSKSLASLTTYPFPCPNCGQPIRTARLYCSELCKQDAEHVRYARRCRLDGRDKLPDVQEALRIRLGMILSGGYPEKERCISPEVRQAVLERDEGRCQICGALGTEIDHISSSSADLDNLQLLCSACHRQKTLSSFVQITPETHPEEWAKAVAIEDRIRATKPQRLSDDSERWPRLWQGIMAKRRRIIRELGSESELADISPINPAVAQAIEFAEVNALIDFDDMSDGEQAEYLALLEGGGDPAWFSAFFGDDA